jgi:hypothetical protein
MLLFFTYPVVGWIHAFSKPHNHLRLLCCRGALQLLASMPTKRTIEATAIDGAEAYTGFET